MRRAQLWVVALSSAAMMSATAHHAHGQDDLLFQRSCDEVILSYQAGMDAILRPDIFPDPELHRELFRLYYELEPSARTLFRSGDQDVARWLDRLLSLSVGPFHYFLPAISEDPAPEEVEACFQTRMWPECSAMYAYVTDLVREMGRVCGDLQMR